MLADIGNFDGVRPDSLHGHDGALHHKGFSDDECVGVIAAFQELLLLDILLPEEGTPLQSCCRRSRFSLRPRAGAE